MEADDTKVVCDQCLAELLWGARLEALNPFDPSQHIHGCPSCFSINTLSWACDEPECWRPVSCGTPMPDGRYRSTCAQHMPKLSHC
jgi:hypothetical protein